MEVECNVTNASSPTASDGSATVQVFGGTPPYSITWTNGISSQQGNTLNNLLPGTYSATVVDYFGDYSVTTECVVGSASQIVYQFNSCPGFAAQTIYVSGSTYASPFPNNKPIIIFNEIVGCWEFIGPISSVGLTYSALTVSNSYANCSACNPPTPTPPTQDTLCLTGSHATLPVQYEFTPDGVDSNGNFKWINTANGLTMSYNVSNAQWEVLTWTSLGSGQPYFGVMTQTQSPPSLQPLGTWQNVGNSGGQKWAWNVATGPCNGTPLSLSIQSISPQCDGQNGVAIMNGNSGTPPYSYNIVGITPTQSSGQFSNVDLSQTNSFVGQVTDSLGNTATTNFTINSGSVSIPYTVQVTKSNQVISNTRQQQVVSYDYQVSIQPTLPSGVSVGLNLDFNNTRTTTYQYSSSAVVYTSVVTGNLNSSPLTFTQTLPTTLSSSPSSNCPNDNIDVTTFKDQTLSLVLNSSSTLNGTVTTTTQLANYVGSGSCNCPLTGTNRINVQAKNIVLINSTCETINRDSNTIQGESTQSGCLSPT